MFAPLMSPGSDPGAEGEVRVDMRVAVPPDRAWDALVDPAALDRWLGELHGALRPGERARLDLGDGDFFALETLAVEPPRRLRYAWRFLGTAPRDTITWEVTPDEGGSNVALLDQEPWRSREAAEALRGRWLELMGRLECFLSTGRDARDTWRRELDGSAELRLEAARARELLLAPGAAGRWLPLDGGRLEEGARWRLDDGGEPAALMVGGLREGGDGGVLFQLSAPGWARPTRCSLAVREHGGGALVVFSQLGWDHVAARPAECLRQRRRAAGAWTAALLRARVIAG